MVGRSRGALRLRVLSGEERSSGRASQGGSCLSAHFEVEVVRPAELSEDDHVTWRRYAESSTLRTPYLSVEYALAAEGLVPEAKVAVVHQRGRLCGFLPFQRRGRRVLPMAAPLTDYHGPLAEPGLELDLDALARAVGHRPFEFTGLIASQAPAGARSRAAMRADVSTGYQAYVAARPRAAKFIAARNKGTRALARELGPIRFEADDADASAFDFVIARKREQYRNSGYHDVFGCGWTERFLRRLWEGRTPGFGLRLCTLRAGEHLLAASLDLFGDRVRHVWFPAYDPTHHRFSPGALLTHAALHSTAEDPTIDTVDFGTEGEAYKARYAEPSQLVFEGRTQAAPPFGPVSRAADHLVGRIGLERARTSLRRRTFIIDACETSTSGRLQGLTAAFASAARKKKVRTASD